MFFKESNSCFERASVGGEHFGVLKGPVCFTFRNLNLVTCAKAYRYPPHEHKSYEMILPLEGSYECVLEGERLQAKPGDFVFGQPGESHEDFYSPGGKFFALLYYIRTPSRALWKSRILAKDAGATFRRRTFSKTSGALAVLDMLKKCFPLDAEGPLPSRAKLVSLCETLFWQAIETLPDEALSQEFKSCSEAESLRFAAFEYFSSAVKEGFSSSRMAARFGLSERALEYKFKKSLGTSPGKAFAFFRINEAAALIEAGATVKEAAEKLGFSDQFHLSKTFKKEMGFSPSELRSKGS